MWGTIYVTLRRALWCLIVEEFGIIKIKYSCPLSSAPYQTLDFKFYALFSSHFPTDRYITYKWFQLRDINRLLTPCESVDNSIESEAPRSKLIQGSKY